MRGTGFRRPRPPRPPPEPSVRVIRPSHISESSVRVRGRGSGTGSGPLGRVRAALVAVPFTLPWAGPRAQGSLSSPKGELELPCLSRSLGRASTAPRAPSTSFSSSVSFITHQAGAGGFSLPCLYTLPWARPRAQGSLSSLGRASTAPRAPFVARALALSRARRSRLATMTDSDG